MNNTHLYLRYRQPGYAIADNPATSIKLNHQLVIRYRPPALATS